MTIRADRDRLIRDFTDLSGRDSESFGERQVADFIIQRLTDLGFDVIEDDAGERYDSAAGNVYGLLRGTRTAEPVLFSAHMDTVKPGIGKRPVVRGGRIVSEGDTVLGADDICGIVEILEGVRLAKERPEGTGDIEVLFTVAEEVYTKGAKVFDFGRVRAKDAYVLDMSGAPGTAARRAPSIVSFEAEISGRASHAGFRPEAGVNALRAAVGAIRRLTLGRVSEEATLNIGTMEAGTADNIVPERCRCTGEVRSFSHGEALALVEKVQHIFQEEAAELGASVSFRQTVRIRAYETPEGGRVCEAFRKACAGLGLAGVIGSTHGGSDNNVFAEKGIEGIVLANGMYETHSTAEYALIDEIADGAELVAALIGERS